MTDAIEVLRRDHQEVKQMLAELEKGPVAASGADENQLTLRKRMTEQVIIEESKHEAVEEEYFWPAVRQHVDDGNRLADHAVEQEQEAKHVLDRLDKLNATEPEFENLLSEFIGAAREHIDTRNNRSGRNSSRRCPPSSGTTSAPSSNRARRWRRPGRTPTSRRLRGFSSPPDPPPLRPTGSGTRSRAATRTEPEPISQPLPRERALPGAAAARLLVSEGRSRGRRRGTRDRTRSRPRSR